MRVTKELTRVANKLMRVANKLTRDMTARCANSETICEGGPRSG
jgi:hypothetical protein